MSYAGLLSGTMPLPTLNLPPLDPIQQMPPQAQQQPSAQMPQQAPQAPPPQNPMTPVQQAMAQQRPASSGGVPVGTVKNFHVFKGGDPTAKTSWEPLTGDAFLQELGKTSPAFAARVKAMGEGRLPFPSGMGSSSAPDALMMKNALALYDPNGMDSIVNGNRAATRKNFSANGEAMQNIRNLNQAIGHAGRLADNIDNVSGASVPIVGKLWNNVVNTVEDQSGAPGIKAFDTDRTALANELASVFKGKGASSEAETTKFYKLLDPNASTPQKQVAIREISDLLNSRLQELSDQYNQGMGTALTPMHFLNPEAAKTFSRLQTIGQSAPAKPAMGGKPSVQDIVDELRKRGAVK